MNKKFSTLMAMALMASSVNGWAQQVYDGSTLVTANSGYAWQTSGGTLSFNVFESDDSYSVGQSESFPAVSPFAISTMYGAKPISALDYVNPTMDGTRSDKRYFQFVVGRVLGDTESKGDGMEVLTMVWKDAGGPTSTDPTNNGHFELNIENVKNANVGKNRITLDRTLWAVTARKDAAGTVLYYEFQNKATQAILQLSATDVVPGSSFTVDGVPVEEVDLKIVQGQTNWRWSDGQIASQSSNLNNPVTGAEIGKVLQGQMRAQYNNGTTIYLAQKKDDSGKRSLTAIKMNSNIPFTGKITNGRTEYYPVEFESWEANPIVLTASQINAELGNENLQTEDKKTKGYFNFEFENDVEGAENIMTKYSFVAEPAKDGFSRVPGDAPDGYVRFYAKGTDQYLRIDTVYHDPSANAQYALKMAVSQILYPRDAVNKDNCTVNSSGYLCGADGNVLNDKDFYVDDDAPYTMRAYTQLKRQSNFRPIFYPATQSLRLQAEMMYRADKNDKAPWWQQMAEDAMRPTNSNTSAGVGGDYMYIAPYAADPAGVNPVNRPADVRGYYPSYVQNLTATTVEQATRLIHYKNSWNVTAADRSTLNGYAPQGTYDFNREGWKSTSNDDKMLWNAVGNVLMVLSDTEVSSKYLKEAIATNYWNGNDLMEPGSVTSVVVNTWVIDPAAQTKSNVTYQALENAAANTLAGTAPVSPVIMAPQFALAHSNLVRLTTLTQGHRVLTTDVHDMNDTEFNGLNTFITLKSVKKEDGLSDVARIEEGFYYIRNAKQMPSDLTKYLDYRYEDLAATNAMFTYWNCNTQKWDRGVSSVDNSNGPQVGGHPNNVASVNDGLNTAMHAKDRSNIGNLVYSKDKKVIPSAQWYIKGNGGEYTIINRESGRVWGTSYWWKTSTPNVYINYATAYDPSTGEALSYRDTIMIEAVPVAELKDRYMGYLHMTQAEAKADTTNYSFGMKNWSEATFALKEDADGKLMLVADSEGKYKLERALVYDKDNLSQATHNTDSLWYGYVPTVNGEVDTTKMLMRAKYYIYKDEVSANSGIEPSSIMTRKYITLESGDYKLTPIKVQDVNGDDYTTNLEADEIANTEGVKVRRAFYIKQISTEDPTQFVLVDPMVVTQTVNGTSTKTAYGARLFANQLSAYVEPASLISNGYANAYASSVFSINKKEAYNYADIRPAGVARDTVEFYSAKTDGQYLLSENCNVAGAHVGLFESLDKLMNKNNAMFLDTANVAYPECPRFLIGLRSEDKFEKSNIDGHNRHLYTDADYLVNMIDSAKTNTAYVYKNQSFNETPYYRLGFIRARHYGDVRFGEKGKPSTLEIAKTGKVYDLGNAALGNTGLNIATFAFRYPNADRSLEDGVYIETMYDHNTRGWLKTINHILVVTPNIQEADLFKVNTETTDVPTANEEIAAGNVVVAGTNGAVVVKGAEGKNVIVSTILGKVVANEVVSSDNATIAAPAGVVVVSVDGESFKVVVK